MSENAKKTWVQPALFRGHLYPMVLFIVFLAVWVAFAIGPRDRLVWLSENALLFVTVPLLILTSRRFRFSNLSYSLIFLFFLLHTIGAHYTYPRVPLNFEFGTGRNNFDRVVHFAFGALIVVPARELFRRVADSKGFWSYYFPFELALAFSAVFEVLEWGVAAIVAPDASVSYLGAQGDAFDPVKDVALAGLGAAITMVAVALYDWRRRRRRFEREFEESLRIKRPDPDVDD